MLSGRLGGGIWIDKLGFELGGGGDSAKLVEGGFGVNGANTANGGVFSGSGKGDGAIDSKGGREKGELMPNNSAREESNG